MKSKKAESVRSITIYLRSPNAEFLKHPPSQGAPEPIFTALARRFPDYVVAGSRIELKRPLSDPALEELMEAAIEAGLTPQKHRRDIPAQVQIIDYRAYTAAEIDAAPLLTCERHDPFIGSVDFDSKSDCIGLCVQRTQWLKRCKNREFGSMVNLFHLLAVRGAAKGILEAAGLKELKLIRLPTNAPSGDWPDGIEPLHLIWSAHMLPEVDSAFDSPHAYELLPPLRYKNLDTKGFDVAITRDQFGAKHPCYRNVVYSQKARGVLERIDKQLVFKPVFVT